MTNIEDDDVTQKAQINDLKIETASLKEETNQLREENASQKAEILKMRSEMSTQADQIAIVIMQVEQLQQMNSKETKEK